MDAGTLHTEIAKVCPVASTRVGVEDDRSTWSFEPGQGATQAQIDAGDQVIATLPVDFKPLTPPSPAAVTVFDHENRIRVIEGVPPLTLADFLTKTKMT